MTKAKDETVEKDNNCVPDYWPFPECNGLDYEGYPGPLVYVSTKDLFDDGFPAEKRDSIFKMIDYCVKESGNEIYIIISKNLRALCRYIIKEYGDSANYKQIWLGQAGYRKEYPIEIVNPPVPYRVSKVDKLLQRVGGEWDKEEYNYVEVLGQIGWLRCNTISKRDEVREKLGLGKYESTEEAKRFFKGWGYNEKTKSIKKNRGGKVRKGYKEFPFCLAPYVFLDEILHGIDEKRTPNEKATKPHKLGIYSIKEEV